MSQMFGGGKGYIARDAYRKALRIAEKHGAALYNERPLGRDYEWWFESFLWDPLSLRRLERDVMADLAAAGLDPMPLVTDEEE